MSTSGQVIPLEYKKIAAPVQVHNDALSQNIETDVEEILNKIRETKDDKLQVVKRVSRFFVALINEDGKYFQKRTEEAFKKQLEGKIDKSVVNACRNLMEHYYAFYTDSHSDNVAVRLANKEHVMHAKDYKLYDCINSDIETTQNSSYKTNFEMLQSAELQGHYQQIYENLGSLKQNLLASKLLGQNSIPVKDKKNDLDDTEHTKAVEKANRTLEELLAQLQKEEKAKKAKQKKKEKNLSREPTKRLIKIMMKKQNIPMNQKHMKKSMTKINPMPYLS